MDEFQIIQQYFLQQHIPSEVALGPGDDAALVQVSAGHQLAVSVDTLIEGVHFFAQTDPYAIGYKSLAVNLSDMAAMGAKARWFTLAISLPHADETWLSAFSQGLFDLSTQYSVGLIGGDTTRGPLSISIQILGEVPSGQAIVRSGAGMNDDIWISGTVGLAALAVSERYGLISLNAQDRAVCYTHLDYPVPKLALGIALRGIATAMIDISDGLLSDLGHIAAASRLGAEVDVALLPHLPLSQSYPDLLTKQLQGGDDYELCFTAPTQLRDQIENIAELTQTPVHRIGHMINANNNRVYCKLRTGEFWYPSYKGYNHFG